MKRTDFAALLLKIQEAEREVREQGQKEYAHSEDNCFANFDSDSGHGVNRLQSIMTHMNKHYRGIQAYVNGHRSQREDIRGRLKDLRLYAALMWGAIDEELVTVISVADEQRWKKLKESIVKPCGCGSGETTFYCATCAEDVCTHCQGDCPLCND